MCIRDRLIVDYGDGNIQQIKDTYSFKVQILESELERFEAGINYELYNVLGAQMCIRDR